MKVSPLDLRQLRFKTRFRGFDKAEVMALIAEVTDDYEHALREIDRLRQDLQRMESLLTEHRELLSAVEGGKPTLIPALLRKHLEFYGT